MIPHRDYQVACRLLKSQLNLFGWIVGISMEHGVDRCFPYCHGDVNGFFQGKPGLLRDFGGHFFRLVYTLERRVQPVGNPHGGQFSALIAQF
jgi:hypothetical protein